MWTPDLRTLFLTLILTDVVLTLILFLYWRKYRTYYGYKIWLISLPVYCCSMTLILFRDLLLTDLFTFVANVLFILVYLMRLDSIQRFVRSKALDPAIYLITLAVTAGVFAYFTYWVNSVAFRGAFLATALTAIVIITCFLLIRSEETETRSIRLALAGIIAGVAGLYIIRAITGFGVTGVETADEFILVYYYALILSDITVTGLFVVLNMARHQAELEQSEQLARENEEKYRSVVTWAKDGIVLVQDHVLKFMNPKAAAIFGGEMTDFLGRPFLSFIPPHEQDSVRETYCSRLSGERTPDVYETVIVDRSGTPVDVELNTGIIELDGKPAGLIFIRDIRERRRSQKALEQAQKKLALLNDITFNEIRRDMFTLTGYQILIRKALDEPGASARPLLEKENAMVQKINEALTFAQTYQDLGLRPARWQSVRHAFLLAISHLDTLHLNRTIATGDLEIFADPLLERVFQILAENVLVHGKTATTITISQREEPDGSLILFFEDDGAGIPGEMKEEIFQPAFQKTRSTGLFLAREILEITEIAIRETGVPTRGARFELHVPKGTFRYRAPQIDDKPT